MILRDPGVEVESQNRLKIDPKTKLGWEGLLASIFHGFWWILEAKMGPSWPPKSNKNRSQEASKNRRQKESVLTASWSRLKPNKGPRQIRRQLAWGLTWGLARGSPLSLKLCYGISLDLRRTVGSEGPIY